MTKGLELHDFLGHTVPVAGKRGPAINESNGFRLVIFVLSPYLPSNLAHEEEISQSGQFKPSIALEHPSFPGVKWYIGLWFICP